MDDLKLPDEMRDTLRASWHHYLDQVQPLRPQLHAYCRRLTHDLWDAEDLAQESLLKAFGTLGRVHDPIRNPRAYLLRMATNLWIDTLRKRERERDAALENSEQFELLAVSGITLIRRAAADRSHPRSTRPRSPRRRGRRRT